MKVLFLSAFLFLVTMNQAWASGFGEPFVLAMDYSVLTRLAQNDVFEEAGKIFDENHFEKKSTPDVQSVSSDDDDEKWESVRDLKNKPRSLSGEASFDANDTVSIGAAAGYTFPEETDQAKYDKAYSLKFNVEMAL